MLILLSNMVTNTLESRISIAVATIMNGRLTNQDNAAGFYIVEGGKLVYKPIIPLDEITPPEELKDPGLDKRALAENDKVAAVGAILADDSSNISNVEYEKLRNSPKKAGIMLKDGSLASRLVVESFMSTMQKFDFSKMMPDEFMYQFIANAFGSFLNADLGEAISTACAVLVKDGRLYLGNIGDSRAYLVRKCEDGNKEVYLLTRDHNMASPRHHDKSELENELDRCRKLDSPALLYSETSDKNAKAYDSIDGTNPFLARVPLS